MPAAVVSVGLIWQWGGYTRPVSVAGVAETYRGVVLVSELDEIVALIARLPGVIDVEVDGESPARLRIETVSPDAARGVEVFILLSDLCSGPVRLVGSAVLVVSE
jgi:hypothetical protein